MHAQFAARQPAPMLALRGAGLRQHAGPIAFGNALGSSLAEAMSPKTQGVGPWSDKDHRNGSDVESDNAMRARDEASALSGVLPKTGPYSNLDAQLALVYGFPRSDSEPPEFSDYPTANASEAMRNIGKRVPGGGAYRNANGNASFGDGAGNRELNLAEDELAAKDAVVDDFMSPKNQASRHDMIGKGLMRGLAREGQIRLQAYDSEGSTPWLLERNEVLGPINDWTTDALIDVGRTHPVLGGLGQVVRGLTFGDGTNLDAGLLALPLVGRAVGGAAKFEGFVERAAVPLGERAGIRFGDEATVNSERYLGLLNRNAEPLTTVQMTEARAYAAKLGLPEENLQFFSHGGAHQRSSYSDLFDTVFIGPDLLPGTGSGLAANSRISANGLLAHEIVGHRETTLAGKAFEAGSLYDEVQASWRAARLAPDLSNSERYLLLRDSVERVHAQGLKVRELDKSRIWFGRPE